jgi:hypothetical protein
MKALGIASAASAGLIALGGCGGGSTNGAQKFASKADAICTHEASSELAATRTPATTTTIASHQVNVLVAGREAALAKLRGLSPPHGQQSGYRAFLKSWPAVEAVWRRNVAGIAKGAAAYDGGGAATVPLAAAEAAASKVGGLAACAGAPAASDRAAIMSFIRRAELQPTASVCTAETSKRFLAVVGGLKACLQSTNTRSAHATVSGLRGTAPIASAQVARTGGNQPAAKLTFWVVKLNGRWQLDDAY